MQEARYEIELSVHGREQCHQCELVLIYSLPFNPFHRVGNSAHDQVAALPMGAFLDRTGPKVASISGGLIFGLGCIVFGLGIVRPCECFPHYGQAS